MNYEVNTEKLHESLSLALKIKKEQSQKSKQELWKVMLSGSKN